MSQAAILGRRAVPSAGMSASGALIRASYAKTVIGGIKRLPDRERDALLKGIGDELRGEIRNYGMLEWMSAARFVELVRAIARTVGDDGAKRFWRANLLLSLERRLLSPLRLGAIAIYGNSPRSLLKMTPQAWSWSRATAARATSKTGHRTASSFASKRCRASCATRRCTYCGAAAANRASSAWASLARPAPQSARPPTLSISQ